MKVTKKNLEALLKKVDPDSLKAEVLNYAIDYADNNGEAKTFFTDLLQYGCQSGMIGGLIYYTDTAEFFDKYYDQIEDLRDSYQDETGEVLKIEGDLKNWLSWFAFEETARKIYEQDLEQEF